MKPLPPLAGFAAAMLLATNGANARTIFQESFEDKTTVPSYNSEIRGWQLLSGSIDTVGKAPESSLQVVCRVPGGTCIDMNGTSGQAARLRSAPINTNGAALVVSFWVSGSERNYGGSGTDEWNSLTARVEDADTGQTLAWGSFSRPYSMGWQRVSMNVLGGANAVILEFNGGADSDDVGLLLDDVAVDTDPSSSVSGPVSGDTALPEPASMALAGAGLLLVLLARKR